MLVFDDDRPEIVHANMLQVAKYTVAISFGGREQVDLDDGASSKLAESEEASPPQLPTAADPSSGAGPPAPLTHVQQTFLLAISRAPQADDDGFRSGPEVGVLFHKLRTATEPTKKERQHVYRGTCAQLISIGRVERKPGPGGENFLRAVSSDDACV